MSYDETTMRIILKCRLEYESPYLSGNIKPNQTMLALRNLMKTPLYINVKNSMRPMWEDMFNITKH